MDQDNNRLFPCRLRGPVAADLHRPRSAYPLETSPSRHPSARAVPIDGSLTVLDVVFRTFVSAIFQSAVVSRADYK